MIWKSLLMGLARVLNSYESVRAFDKSIDWCIQFDSLGWDGSYFKIALELQAEYEQGTKPLLQASA